MGKKEDMRGHLGNLIYAAAVPITEGAEHKGLYSGNGHHLAQDIVEAVADKLLEDQLVSSLLLQKETQNKEVKILKTPEEWQDEWPTEIGYWWFYGRKYHAKDDSLHFVQVKGPTGDGKYMYVVDGAFIYKAEGACGQWTKVQLPQLPKR